MVYQPIDGEVGRAVLYDVPMLDAGEDVAETIVLPADRRRSLIFRDVRKSAVSERALSTS
jgi:hypothetical protein